MRNRLAELEPKRTKAKAAPDHNGEAPRTIELAELRQERIRVTIYGVSPLIVHAWSAKTIGMIEEKQQKRGKTTREAKDPAAEMRGALYVDAKGRECFPARGIKASIVSAATSLGDRINFSAKKIRQGLFVIGDLIPIEGSKASMRTDMVRVGQGSADVRYRPEYTEWSMTFDIEFNAHVFSGAQIAQLIEVAGFGVGIGEWRPERGGNNGRYSLKRPE